MFVEYLSRVDACEVVRPASATDVLLFDVLWSWKIDCFSFSSFRDFQEPIGLWSPAID